MKLAYINISFLRIFAGKYKKNLCLSVTRVLEIRTYVLSIRNS